MNTDPIVRALCEHSLRPETHLCVTKAGGEERTLVVCSTCGRLYNLEILTGLQSYQDVIDGLAPGKVVVVHE